MVLVIIKNFEELASTKMRRDLLTILNAGISAVLPEKLMSGVVKYDPELEILKINDFQLDLTKGRLFVIGAGKAAGRMGVFFEKLIPSDKLGGGCLICNTKEFKPELLDLYLAGHPEPDQRNITGVKKILELKEKYSITKLDTVLCLLSGGGSALLTYPVSEVVLEEMQKTNELLLSSGAEIKEINAVRKHLSQVTGGRLGLYFEPTTVISLIISDIISNPLDAIASGPTAPDSTTFHTAYEVLRKYNLLDVVPTSVRNYIGNNLENQLLETPKRLANCKNFIIGDNKIAIESMFEMAKTLGYEPLVVSTEVTGEPNYEARKRAHYIKIAKYSDYNALILAGETTPVLPKNHGLGGRNQHYVAASILEMNKLDYEWALASISTDGADYLKGIAGAVVDHRSFNIVEKKGLDIQQYIDRYNSHSLLKELGNSLVMTGDTGSNVGDLIVYLLARTYYGKESGE